MLLQPSFPVGAGAVVDNMYVTGTAVSGPAYNTFLNKWQARHGEVPQADFHAFAYDATNLLLNAIEAVAQVGSNGALVIGRDALRQAVAETADFPGLTGSMTCDSFGDCASKEVIGVYQFTTTEVLGRRWPPLLVTNEGQ
jgi:branched-chain amino acid transport system substrate-binding protein